MKKSILLLVVIVAAMLVVTSCIKPLKPTEATLEITSIVVSDNEATISWKLNTTAEIVSASYTLHVGEAEYESQETSKTVTLAAGTHQVKVEGEIKGKYEATYGQPAVHVESETETVEIMQEYGNTLLINLVEYMTGPAAEGVSLEVFDGETGAFLGSGETDIEGKAEIDLLWLLSPGLLEVREVTVKAEKTGLAPSVLEGLAVPLIPSNELASAGSPLPVDMAINRAMIDPLDGSYPEIEITLLDGNGNEIDPTDVSTNVYLNIEYASDLEYDVWDVLYVGVGYVPWAGVRDFASFGMSKAAFAIPAEIFNGDLPVHVVVYNYNRARLDRVVNLNFTAEKAGPAETSPPTGVWLWSWTSDANVNYYSLPKEINGRKLNLDEETFENLMGAPAEGNIFVQIAWDLPENLAGLVGFNIYRSSDGVNYKKIAFRTALYGFDSGIGIEAGNRYFYKVRSVYADGSESEDSNIASVVPLDIFKVKLLSPANNSTGVSRRPVLKWAPVDKINSNKVPVLGGGLLDESKIAYHYTPWIYDTVQSDYQHLLAVDSEFETFDFSTYGPQQVSVKFLDPFWLGKVMNWIFILNGQAYLYPFDQLEAFKTYEWGLDYAVATYYGYDEDGDGFYDSVAYSTTIDLGYDFDRWVNDADYYNRFTTGGDN
ncbi:MAG TPA: hypothetical protein PLO21_10030 [Mesotoga sp.]|nr:hypothetical protein [Mesotoga sp.]HQC57377.1 hypothetical protein [Mesotoga sp.]